MLRLLFIPLILLVIVIGLVILRQVPDIQRYMRLRNM